MNLGDEIQTIATERVLDVLGARIAYYYDRDTRTLCERGPHREHGVRTEAPVGAGAGAGMSVGTRAGASAGASASASADARIRIIYNGWFDGNYTSWPDTDKYAVTTVSTHINENPKDSSYAWLNDSTRKFVSLADASHAAFYSGRRFGCRDIHTYSMLSRALPRMHLSAPAEVYISGCISATLGYDFATGTAAVQRTFDIGGSTGAIYIVDVDRSCLERYVPASILDNAKYISHVYPFDVTAPGARDLKFAMARQFLAMYREAALVITSRLHCAIPCLSYGTPVLFFYEAWAPNDVRFVGNLDTIPTIGRDPIDYGCVVNVLPPEYEQRVRAVYAAVAGAVRG